MPAPAPALTFGAQNGAAANVSLNMPAQAAALLQQAFASLQGLNTPPQTEANGAIEEKKNKAKVEPIKELSKATVFDEKPESSS